MSAALTLAKEPALYPFQAEGITRIASAPLNRYILNFECGLGKTPTAIRAAICLGAKRVLVVCPAVVRRSWAAEFARWWPSHPSIGLLTASRDRDLGSVAKCAERDAAYAADIQICSPELVQHLDHSHRDVIILDELHRFKNPAAVYVKKLTELLKGGAPTAIIGLTATLMPDRITDLYGELNILWPGRFGKLDKNGKGSWKFNTRYSNAEHNGYGWRFSGVNELYIEELQERLAAVSYRVTRHEVAHLLPAFDVSLLFVQSVVPAHMTEDVTQLGVHKLDHIDEWVRDALAGSSHVAVLTHYRQTAHDIAERFLQLKTGLVPYVITGATTSDERAQIFAASKQDARAVLIATMHAVGIGVDLTHFTHALFAELYYRPETLIQALGRFSRLSSKVPSAVQIMVLQNTIDEVIANRVLGKVSAINAVVKAGGGEEALLGALQEPEDDAFFAQMAAAIGNMQDEELMT